jgi:histidine phosphotransferase ChpT
VHDLRLCELLAARLCHDLVGPVGAVANGVELIGEDGSGADAEVVRLISGSAKVASNRLQAFRVAFGSGNTLPSAGWSNTVRDLALGLVEENKASLDWQSIAPDLEAKVDRRLAKVMLNLVLIALDSMIRGGTVRLEAEAAKGAFVLTVPPCGDRAGRARSPTRSAPAWKACSTSPRPHQRLRPPTWLHPSRANWGRRSRFPLIRHPNSRSG